jgi:hypothetical protein
MLTYLKDLFKRRPTSNPCAEIKISKYDLIDDSIDGLIKGDTVSLSGIGGILIIKRRLGIVALRPVPYALSDSERRRIQNSGIHNGARGGIFFLDGKTMLWHLETFECEDIIFGKRIVLVEKHIFGTSREKKRLK